MKISTDWIKDFVDLPEGLTDREIAERITLGVCEVEGRERTGAMLGKVTVASVDKVVPHPDADKLRLATVSLGGGRHATVVCGAPNCREGIRVPYAALGTSFPDGFTLEPKKIRGILSEGMLCSERELGLSENHEGLMELPSDAPVGQTLAAALGGSVVDDLILDIDNKSLTHRPDLWGHYGMAREFAAVFDRPYRDRLDKSWADALKARIAGTAGLPAPVTIHVEKDSANRGFLGLTVQGITVGSSPEWMQRRLTAAGMRPINSIVDISNYAMLETGIPNHIFDVSTIRGGKIKVRRAGEIQVFVTLDGHERHLIPSDTLVCDAEKPSAIAGIMGGLESSVADDTAGIMIEVANWTDSEIRRTSTRLGLRTDASQRYEKSLDSQQLEKALLRIYELVLEQNPGARAVGGIQSDNMPDLVKLAIDTSPARIANVLGKDFGDERLTRILTSLGFGVEPIPGAVPGPDRRGKTLRVHVPTWRSTKDVEYEVDIVEEIGRIVGFDNISPESPAHDIAALRLSPGKSMVRRIQDFLVLRGRALEVMTYPLVGLPLLERSAWPVRNEGLVLANALTPDHDRMRPSLIPSLLEAAANNRKEHEAFRIFEVGRSYADLGGDRFSRDLHQIGIVFQESRDNPFIELANTVEALLSCLSLPVKVLPAEPAKEYPLVPRGWAGTHPHEMLELQIMGKSRGVVLTLHPQMAMVFKIKGRTAMAVIDITDLMNLPVKDKTAFKPLDRFPGADFDLTVVVPPGVHAADVVGVVRNLKVKEIRSVGVLDVFPLEGAGRALTLHVDFRDPDKTLDAEFLSTAEAKIVAVLAKAGFPLRS
jgi:phenylalanyl-tRNA synthetase beta chain